MRNTHLILAGLVLALSGPLTAATIEVDTPVDTIDESDGACSLREALINSANNDQSGSRNCEAGEAATDTILFSGLPANATITLTAGVLPTISDDLEIFGPDPDNPGSLVIDAQNASRIFEVDGVQLTLRGLTLANGTTDKDDEPGGAMHISGGADVSLQDLFVIDSMTEGVDSPGGAIYAANAAQLSLSNVQMARNQARAAGGGAIFVTGTPLSVVDSVFGENLASGRGGAIHAVGDPVSITSSIFLQNSTSGDSSFGGALFMDGAGLVMTGTELISNTTSGANSHGGALYLRNATLSVSGGIFDRNSVAGFSANGGAISTIEAEVNLFGGCQLIGNATLQANGWGGAMRIGTGNLEVDDCLVSNNRTQGDNAHGGAIYVITGNATIGNSQIVGNQTQGAGAQGGGIRVLNGNLSVDNSLVQNNSTAGEGARGGGIYHRNGQSRLIGVTVIGNTTAGLDAHGAGVYLLDSDLDFQNGEIANNRIDGTAVGAGMGLFSGDFQIHGASFSANLGTGSGGAIHVADGPVRIVNSTISANQVATGTGAAVFGNRSDVELLHVTVADNINPPGNLSHLYVTGSDTDRASLTLDNSLVIGNRCGLGTLSSISVAGSLVTDASCIGQVVPAEALAIEPLAANGGFAPTHALGGGSIAIDAAGNCPVEFSVTEDQRGLPRPGVSTSQCDVGAYERQSPQEPADLQAGLLINPAAARPGQTLSVLVDITNASTRWASGVEVGLDIGNALLIQEADFSVGEIDAGFEAWTIGLLAPQQTVSLALTMELAASGSREAVVSLVGDQPDPDTGNNLVSQTVLDAQPSVNLLVNTLADNQIVDGLCSLREAMLNAENADQSGSIDCLTGGFESNTIEFHPDLIGGTIVLSGQALPEITRTLEILGPVPGDQSGLTIDGNEQSRIFVVHQAQGVLLSDLQLVNGRTAENGQPGGIVLIENNAEISLFNIELRDGQTAEGAESRGGALAAIDSELTLVQVSVIDNRSSGDGGGLFVRDSMFVIEASTVANNLSQRFGGGLLLSRSVGQVRNSTVSGNETQTGSGSGLYLGGGEVDLVQSTLAFNQGPRASTPGVFVFAPEGVPTQLNLIGALLLETNCSGSVVADAATLSTRTGCDAQVLPLEVLSVGPLSDNGGATLTHALLPGSLAIDAAGSCPSGLDQDQRGQPRPGGSTSVCDAGAYEFQGDAPAADLAVELSSQDLLTEVGRQVTIEVELAQNGPDVASDVSVTLDWPAGLEFGSALRPNGTSFDGQSGLWDIGVLDAGQSLSMTLSLTAAGAGSATVSVSASTQQNDPNSANDSAELLVQVLPEPQPIIVTTLADTVAEDGVCGLREAMLNASNNDQSGSTDCGQGSPFSDEIHFDSALAGGTLVLAGQALPSVTERLDIFGPQPDNADGLIIDAGGQSGLLHLSGPFSSSIEGLTLTGGQTDSGGSAIRAEGLSRLSLRHVRLNGNAASGIGGHGAALHLIDTTVALRDCELSDNTSTQGHGGAVFVSDVVIEFQRCLLADNQAPDGSGGAIHASGLSLVSLDTSTVSGNQASAVGGIYIDGGQFDLAFASVIDNQAGNGAADLLLANPTTQLLGQSQLVGSLIAQLASGVTSCQIDAAAEISITDSLTTDSTCPGTAVAAAQLDLQPLGDNGGMTRTHALAEGSVALDVAECPAISRLDVAIPVDQRGQPRPGSGSARCDAGAYERQGAAGDRIFGDGFEAFGR
ncbi:MAG: choice-of-anchor Q domain-containing protein [Wenzhouxiangella sp.]